jgi:uncharacterized RDD family membrane protein YckC
MQCRYCRAWNSNEEHRCTRCGRRLWVVNSRPMSEATPIQTATAPDYIEYEREQETITSEAPPGPERPLYQRPLFREMQQVVEMQPLHTEERDRPAKPHKPKPPRRVHADQQALDFGAPRTRASLDTLIYCNAPVALPVHRTMASALDVSMIVMATALFVLTFQFGAGSVTVDAHSAAVMAAIAGVLGVFYHLLFALLGEGRTPGMAWTQLELVNFDGRRPTREQRMRRLLSGVLSTAAAGLGLLWAVVDEEKLTWHDHISRTFPTPRERDK